VEVAHAIFDKKRAQNTWSIQSKLLREFTEYFGPRTEQLDIFSENGRATFTSYTEKITDGKGTQSPPPIPPRLHSPSISHIPYTEVLKAPLHTSIALDTLDFTTFSAEDGLHIGISVKDFKSIVIHAETLHTTVTARFSRPGRPLQLSYEQGGMLCEFTLMTLSDVNASDTTSTATGTATPRNASARPESRQPSTISFAASKAVKTALSAAPRPDQQPQAPMPPPPLASVTTDPAKPTSINRSVTSQPSQSSQQQRNSPMKPLSSAPPPPQSTLDPNSLFIPCDDDRRWDEPAYEDADEDMLGWDTSAEYVRILYTFVPYGVFVSVC
jgi:cell cycle checkpoint control protein RAD9A